MEKFLHLPSTPPPPPEVVTSEKIKISTKENRGLVGNEVNLVHTFHLLSTPPPPPPEVVTGEKEKIPTKENRGLTIDEVNLAHTFHLPSKPPPQQAIKSGGGNYKLEGDMNATHHISSTEGPDVVQ